MESKDKKIFISRVIGWSIFSCLIPVAFIGWRYDLFKKAGALQLSGWGLIGIIIIIIFLIIFIRYIDLGFKEWSMTKQIINGILKVLLPIGAVLALFIGVRSQLDYFIQALSCTLLSEAIAIPLNPFPEWIYNKTKGQFEGMVDYIAGKFNRDKKEGE